MFLDSNGCLILPCMDVTKLIFCCWRFKLFKNLCYGQCSDEHSYILVHLLKYFCKMNFLNPVSF